MLNLLLISQIVVNGSFETGDLTGWTTGGLGFAEALQASNVIGGVVNPTDGVWMLHISTQEGPEVLWGDADSNGELEYDYSFVEQTFITPGNACDIYFNLLYATSEWDWAPVYDDLFRLSLDSTAQFLEYSTYGPVSSPWPDYDPASYNFVWLTISSTGPTNTAYYDDGVVNIGWQTFTFAAAAAGSHTLRFEVWDQGDGILPSGLFIDRVVVDCPLGPEEGAGGAELTAPSFAPGGVWNVTWTGLPADLILYDAAGRTVLSVKGLAGAKGLVLSLPAGVYLYRLTREGEPLASGKVTVQ